MIENRIKDEIQSAALSIFNIHLKTEDINVERPAKKENGDFSSNVSFSLAVKLNLKPAEVAHQLAGAISKTSSFKQVSSVGPFLNLFISKEEIISSLKEIIRLGNNFGKSKLFSGKKVQVEFISANPTGPLTLGNSRGGFPGDVLANLFTWAGADVTREYYFNNGGNQIKTLGISILAAAGLASAEGDYYKGEYIEDWVKEHGNEIEKLQNESMKLGQMASTDIIENYLKPTIKKMKIKFDTWFNEVDLLNSGEVEKVIERLRKKDEVLEKEGATWFCSTKHGDEKDRVMVKSDGSYTYFAVDAAYHWNKFAIRKFDKVVNIWGADHHGDVLRVLGAVDALGYPGRLDILLTQFVRLIKDGQEFKMSKRKGTYVTLDDLLDLIGGPVEEASDVARFFFLSRSSNTHMDFDLDLAREHSEKNPVYYVKYAHARICGILRNSENLALPKADLSLLGEPAEIELIEEIRKLPVIVESILTTADYPVHNLTFFAREVATKFHSFYDKCRVLDEGNLNTTAARLELVRLTKNILGSVMTDLIGIEAPEKM